MRQRFTLLVMAFLLGATSLLAQDAAKEAAKAYRKGMHRFKQYDYLRSLPHLKSAANLGPSMAKYHFAVGKCLYYAWKERESLPYLQRAWAIDHNVDPEIHYFLGRTLHLNGDFTQAIDHYREDLRNYESENDANYQATLLRIKQCETAIKLSDSDYKDYEVDNMGEFVNSGWPDYAATFAADYNYMLFTSRRPAKDADAARSRYLPEDVNEEVFSSHYENGTWAQTQRFRKPIHVFNHDASVSLSEDGQTMVYYQGRNYGDIYVSRQEEEGKWSKRTSIGPTINTDKYQEPSVFIADDGGTILFVSSKPGGQGGLDIYMAPSAGNGAWGEGDNLGSAINTAYDEDAPFLSENGKVLYFASNGPTSMGGYDIFKCEKQPNGSWGTPVNLGPGINSPGDDIYFYPRRDGQGFFLSSDRPGGLGDMDLYYAHVADIDKPGPLTTALGGTVVDRQSNEPVNASVTLTDPVTGETVVEMVSKADQTFSFTLPKAGKNYDLKVKVDAPAANPTGVIPGNYIAGTLKDAENKMPLSGTIRVVDNNTGTVLNTVSTDPSNGFFMVSVPGKGNYSLQANSPAYESADEKMMFTGMVPDKYKNIDLMLRRGPEADFTLKGQNFASTQWNLLPQGRTEMDKVVALMKKNGNVKLSIVGHTDDLGGAEYNLDLSRKRAEAVKQYLVDHGIAADRMVTQGMGQTQPLNDNGDDGKRAMNRRVELYIIK